MQCRVQVVGMGRRWGEVGRGGGLQAIQLMDQAGDGHSGSIHATKQCNQEVNSVCRDLNSVKCEVSVSVGALSVCIIMWANPPDGQPARHVACLVSLPLG